MAFCPFPLILSQTPATLTIFQIPNATGGLTNNFCSFRCEGTMYTQDDIDRYSVMVTTLSGLSVFLCSFILFTWGLFSVKAKQKMTFWVSVCSICASLAIFLPAAFNRGAKNVWCKNELEPNRQKDGLSGCVIQGLCLIFFSLALVSWWWCSCFDLFIKIFLRKKKVNHYLTYYTILSWTLPSLCTAVLLFSSSFGFNQPRLWCFLVPEAPDAYEYVFFYGWIGLFWVTGTILMLFVIYALLVTPAKGKHKKNANRWRKLSIYRVPIVFALIFSLFWAILFTFVVVLDAQESSFRTSAESWGRCLIAGTFQFGNPSPHNTDHPGVGALIPPAPPGQVGCGEVQPNRIPPALMFLAVTVVAGNGVLLFLVFAFQWENFRLWGNWISSGFDPSSVRPKGWVGRTIKGRPMSTFKEIRVRIAEIFMFGCELFAGEDLAALKDHRLLNPSKSHRDKSQQRLQLTTSNENYEPQFLPRMPVNSTGSRAAEYPRVSYKDGQNVPVADPFPSNASRHSEGLPPPPGLQRFYQSGSNVGSNSQGGDFPDDDGFSDYYDPLWGHVEF